MDYNHEFQPNINLFLKFKSPFQIKIKSRLWGVKNKKRFNVKIRLEKSSTQQDRSRFEYELDETFQTSVENCRVDKGGRVNRTSKADRGGKVGRANRSEQLNRTAKGKRVGKAGRVGRDRGKKKQICYYWQN